MKHMMSYLSTQQISDPKLAVTRWDSMKKCPDELLI